MKVMVFCSEFGPIAMLQELVPCVLLSFDEEKILMWRGKDWKSRYQVPLSFDMRHHHTESGNSSDLNDSGVSIFLCG